MRNRDELSEEEILKKMQSYSQESTEPFFENGLYAESDSIFDTASLLGREYDLSLLGVKARKKERAIFETIKGLNSGRGNMGLILEIPKEYIYGDKKDKLFQQGLLQDVASGSHATDFKNVIPTTFIKTAIISTGKGKEYYFLNNDNYKNAEFNKDYTEQIDDLRIQMEWFYKGQSLLRAEDINKQCSLMGLDFNEEMQQANCRVKFKTELDEYDKLPREEKNLKWDDMANEAKSLDLILKDELFFAHARNQLREEMCKYHAGTSDKTAQEIGIECKALGLNYNYEMTFVRDSIKKGEDNIPIKELLIGSVKKIASEEKARGVQSVQSELRNDYLELENPTQTKDNSVSLDE